MSKRWLPTVVLCAGLWALPSAWAADGRLASAAVTTSQRESSSGFDGVVEAVRSSIVAAQVSGAVTSIDVKAGDRVKAGQVVARIDARSAEQNAGASEAQVRAAQAMLDVARSEYERQQQLHRQNYISQAALERAESQFKAARAQTTAQRAQADAARTQSGLHVLRAPYAGIVAEVPVALGDMAMPGKALLVIYEPGALRVTAAVPQSALPASLAGVKVELPGLPEAQRWFSGEQAQILPLVDAATHTAQLRIDLPAGASALRPGMFARVWLPGAAAAGPRLFVPAAAVLRRGELTGVYVLDDRGAPMLRQVRLGRPDGTRIEVLTGVSAGELVALDPQAAARAR
ncbi:MAG: efflux RND transporter periplasmic adaptor subunit [Rubrivivax sp.]